MTNVFNQPLTYISEIEKHISIPIEKRKTFKGKTMAFVFLTKFCEVECAHCFFRSRKSKEVKNKKEYELSEEGIEKLITFLNQSNNGYLAILGGGEPFHRFDYILKILENVKTDQIVLVTSGVWATDDKQAKTMIDTMAEVIRKRKNKTQVILRVSVDKWHRSKISADTICHIIEIMKPYQERQDIKLQLHGINGDTTLEETLKQYGNFKVENKRNLASDNDKILKIGYQRYDCIFDNGMKIEVGLAQKFFSNLKVNLKKQQENLKDILKIFEDDIERNCFGNPSLVKNKENEDGLDFLMSYNGNVSTWCNEQTYDLNNIYKHSYDEVINRTFQNVISYSFIDKGYQYRENIFKEVNPLAVLKSKAINIRDYSCASLMEERNSVLYYAIRVIQDYIKENILEVENLKGLSKELQEVIKLPKWQVIELYHKASYTILDEYWGKEGVTKEEWKDLFNLIDLGHYNIEENDVKDAIYYFNANYHENIKGIEECKENSSEQYERLLNRVSYMRQDVKEAL